jgi:hypothetical protein
MNLIIYVLLTRDKKAFNEASISSWTTNRVFSNSTTCWLHIMNPITGGVFHKQHSEEGSSGTSTVSMLLLGVQSGAINCGQYWVEI